MKKAVARKIKLYKKSLKLDDAGYTSVSRECRRLEEKLELPRITPKQYIFLKSIKDNAGLGKDLNLSSLAKRAGYTRTQYENPEVAILRNIPDKLFQEMVGYSRQDVEFELKKIAEQDEDLSSKIRALELLSKILGMQDDSDKIAIQINSGFELAD